MAFLTWPWPNVLLGKTPDRRALLLKSFVACVKPAVELMAEQQAEEHKPGLQGRDAYQCADDFAPVQERSLRSIVA